MSASTPASSGKGGGEPAGVSTCGASRSNTCNNCIDSRRPWDRPSGESNCLNWIHNQHTRNLRLPDQTRLFTSSTLRAREKIP
jgi:hypothetical protein